jgi:hypothetical protein
MYEETLGVNRLTKDFVPLEKRPREVVYSYAM